MPLLPREFVDATAHISSEEPGLAPKPLGAGFLVGFPVGDADADGQRPYRVLFVTHASAFEGQSHVSLTFDRGREPVRATLNLEDDQGQRTWVRHPESPVAATRVDVGALREAGIRFNWIPSSFLVDGDRMQQVGITVGMDVFVIGYPMGLIDEPRDLAIVRDGVIARLDHDGHASSNRFLVDATVLPGSRGGPVVLRPETASLPGEEPVRSPFVLGVSAEFLDYREIVPHQHSGEDVEIVLNASLVEVLPLDPVMSIADGLLGDAISPLRRDSLAFKAQEEALAKPSG